MPGISLKRLFPREPQIDAEEKKYPQITQISF